jgi:hypothetical protein
MPATWVANDDVNGIFSQVMEHQDAHITDLWTTSDHKINPMLASFEARSEDDGGGRGFITRVGISTGTSANPSYTLAAAKAASSELGNSALNGRWVSQPTELNVIAQWTRRAMDAARKDGPGEVYDVIARERESKMVLARHRLAVFAVEAGWGRVATVTAISASSLTFTVATSEVNRFRPGDDICFSSSENAALLRGNGVSPNAGTSTKWTVKGTNPRTGVVTLLAASDTGSRGTDYPVNTDSVAVGDTVFWYGYRQNSATPSRLCPIGMKGWVPFTDPTGTELTAFQGLDRTAQWALMGLRMDASAGTQLSHAEAFLEMAGLATQYTTELDAIYTSVPDYTMLCRNKDAVKLVETKVGAYKIGFEGVSVLGGPSGNVPILPDVYIPQGYAWGGPWNNAEYGCKLKHSRQLINVDDMDGNEFLRLATSTGYEQRMYVDCAMIVPGPGKFIACSGLPTS